MELPIIPKFEEHFLRCLDPNIQEQIRILDIDGIYLVSRITVDKPTNSFMKKTEVAFDSEREAKRYLNVEFGIDFSEEEPTIGDHIIMTNAMALVPQRPMIPSDHEMMVFQTMAKQAVQSKMYRGIGDEFAVMTIMLAAREFDIPPMAALNGGINIIGGKTEISARMMGALIMRRGHTIKIIESTDTKCILQGMRSNGQIETESFTIEEAKQAGLIKEGGGWKKWPKDMCYARCLSRLARRLFPDVIGMGYIEGEIRDKEIIPMGNTTTFSLPEMETTTLDQEILSKEELLKNFLSQFDKEESIGWEHYIEQLQDKLGITVEHIIKKFNADPVLAKEKYQAWAHKQGHA